ncbi:MAG TPA: nitrate reductase molybdenum cofactor assembly chaperone [Paracoccaceae bacterium]|nr:nitrate reductase molybdenum cofactor assembly chaperone [Paracoccaceae bacterium]
MIRTLKAMSALLSYPSAELQAAAGEIGAVLRAEALLPVPALTALAPLLEELATGDLYDLEARYVALFDRSRSLSLNLFEHVHGESRDRGGAMVDLIETYRAGGFEPVTTELPDHLPVLLEFLSLRPLAEAREMLGDAASILARLRDRLERRDPAYASVLAALLAIARVAPEPVQPAEEEDPDDLAALDRAWEETQVTFGPDPNAGCPAARDLLARMAPTKRPAWAGAAE